MTGAGLRAPLPRGLIGGTRITEAELRPLTGRDEERLAAGGGRSMAVRVTELLSRCVVALDGVPPDADGVRSLSVGDREALLLHLRRATLGDGIDCVATCPGSACGERLDVRLRVGDVLVERSVEAVEWYDEAFEAPDGGSGIQVRFRLPTGADQEATASLAALDPEAAGRALLERCLAPLSADGDEVAADLPDELADRVAARMAVLDPQAEIRLRFVCAACRRPIDVLFDTAAFFFAEIAATAGRLYDEVHAIAWHYHWSEAEILELPRDRRRRYLDLIAASLGPRQARGVA